MRHRFVASLLALSGVAWLACSDKALKSPQSDTNYDDSQDPGTGGVVSSGGVDAGAMNPADAGGGKPIAMPSGKGGIGFDELRFSKTLGKVLVPAGRSGNLDLVDPASMAVTAIGGFSMLSGFDGTHTDGTTSADEGGGIVFAIDRTNRRLDVVDPARGVIVASAVLAAAPDYVRYVAPTNEVWVTESGGIEVFTLDAMNKPTSATVIAMAPAPEGLEIDATGKRAYTNVAAGTTAAVDIMQRAVVEMWPNGCTTAHGIQLDPAKGLVFVGCAEGKVMALDAAHMGAQLGSATTAQGVDLIAYDATRGRLYVPGIAGPGALTVVSVDATGKLTALGTVPVVAGAHCVTVDLGSNVYLCDSPDGEIVTIHDAF
jgi:hypothetical protein